MVPAFGASVASTGAGAVSGVMGGPVVAGNLTVPILSVARSMHGDCQGMKRWRRVLLILNGMVAAVVLPWLGSAPLAAVPATE